MINRWSGEVMLLIDAIRCVKRKATQFLSSRASNWIVFLQFSVTLFPNLPVPAFLPAKCLQSADARIRFFYCQWHLSSLRLPNTNAKNIFNFVPARKNTILSTCPKIETNLVARTQTTEEITTNYTSIRTMEKVSSLIRTYVTTKTGISESSTRLAEKSIIQLSAFLQSFGWSWT